MAHRAKSNLSIGGISSATPCNARSGVARNQAWRKHQWQNIDGLAKRALYTVASNEKMAAENIAKPAI